MKSLGEVEIPFIRIEDTSHVAEAKCNADAQQTSGTGSLQMEARGWPQFKK